MRLAVIIVLVASATASAAPILAEAGEPVRDRSDRIDIPATIEVLRREGVNVYLYQIWRYAGDWDQLPEFADAAEAAGIEVWVYLVPWSETPLKNKSFAYPEPFRTDYIAWADAIGKAARRHRAITAWVMDDFFENAHEPNRFTDEYVDRMLAAGKRHHPSLRFYPVVYFQQPWAEFVNRFASKIDGVIARYPRSQRQVDNALRYLRDEGNGPSLLTTFTRKRAVKEGSTTAITTSLPAELARGGALEFYFEDQVFGYQQGSHVTFAEVNGQPLWKREFDGGKIDEIVAVNLDDAASSRGSVDLAVGIHVLDTEADVLVQTRFSDIRIYDRRGRIIDVNWALHAGDSMNAVLAPADRGGRRFSVPMLILIATLPSQHEKRYDEPGTVENIRKKLNFAIDNVETGNAVGVVCWYTPKGDRQLVRMIGEVFSRVRR